MLSAWAGEQDPSAKAEGQESWEQGVTLGFVQISSSCSLQPCTLQGNLSGRQEKPRDVWEGEDAAVSSVAHVGITVSPMCLVTSDPGRRGSVLSGGHGII